jgi:uncharacterized protein
MLTESPKVRLPVFGSSSEAPAAGEKLKPSRYNVFSQREGAVWAFNSRSTAFARLSKEQYTVVERLLRDPVKPTDPEESKIYQSLLHGQFLIAESFDELSMLKVKNQLTRFSSQGIGLVIAPTLRCNFSCEYCYVDLNANKMSPETRQRVKRFFDHQLQPKTGASICWTGGDPSLALDVVEELSLSFIETCQKKECPYEAVMITNGYLLDEKMLQVIRTSQIKGLQITFDGDREAHNERRHLPGHRPTYDRILENVARACKEVAVAVRINIDRHNYQNIDRTLRDLAAKTVGGKVSVYFANLEAVNEQSSRYADRSLSTAEYSKIQPGLAKLAYDIGFRAPYNDLRMLRGEFCGANARNYYVIDSSAQLLKCYNDLGTADRNGIGYIADDGKEVIDKHGNLLRWLAWDPFEIQECRDCKVLPLCMGGCSYSMVKGGPHAELGCLTLRYTIDEILEMYGQRMANPGGSAGAGGCASGACSRM